LTGLKRCLKPVGARNLLQAALENEIIEYIEYIQLHKDRRDENGQQREGDRGSKYGQGRTVTVRMLVSGVE
jgi:hypothetical protein